MSMNDAMMYGLFGLFVAACICAIPAFVAVLFIMVRGLWELIHD